MQRSKGKIRTFFFRFRIFRSRSKRAREIKDETGCMCAGTRGEAHDACAYQSSALEPSVTSARTDSSGSQCAAWLPATCEQSPQCGLRTRARPLSPFIVIRYSTTKLRVGVGHFEPLSARPTASRTARDEIQCSFGRVSCALLEFPI